MNSAWGIVLSAHICLCTGIADIPLAEALPLALFLRNRMKILLYFGDTRSRSLVPASQPKDSLSKYQIIASLSLSVLETEIVYFFIVRNILVLITQLE